VNEPFITSDLQIAGGRFITKPWRREMFKESLLARCALDFARDFASDTVCVC